MTGDWRQLLGVLWLLQLNKYYWVNKIKNYEKGKACGTYVVGVEHTQGAGTEMWQ